MSVPSAAELIALVDPQAARTALAGVAIRTPTIACDELSELAGTQVVLKAECLQALGLVQAARRAREDGGAGRRRRRRGRSARAPATTPAHWRSAARVEGSRAARSSCRATPPSRRSPRSRELGAQVHLGGESVDDAVALAASARGRDGRGVRAPVRRPRRDRRPGHARAGAARGRAGPGARDRAGRRRRARERDRGSPCAARVRRSSSWACRPRRARRSRTSSAARSLRARGALAPGATIADGIAIKRPGSAHVHAAARVHAARAHGRRGRDRRRDRVPRGTRAARRRGRGRGHRRGAARRAPRAGRGDDRRDRLGRQHRQRPARGPAAPPRNREGPADARVHARAGPSRRPRGAAQRSSPTAART